MPSTFLKLLRHDLLSGFSQNKYKYGIVVLVVIMLCMSCFTLSQDIWLIDEFDNLVKFNGATSISDYFVYMSQGIDVYDPSTKEPFEFPFFWAIIQILIALLVATYPTNDLRGYARNVFLRTPSKSVWWYAKISWTVLTVLSFYLLAAIVVTVFALLVGDTAIMPVSEVSLYVSGVDALGAPASDLLMALAAGIFASVLLAVTQVVLSFFIKPMFSFVAVMAYIIASAFFHTPVLMADYSMLLRNGSLLGDGMSSMAMIATCCAAAIVFSVAGGLLFKRRDIL